MRIGLLITSIGNFGQKGFYNAQEIGLAKELDKLFDEVIVYKAVPFSEKKSCSFIDGCLHSSLLQIPVKSRGINGKWDCSVMDATLDALIYFSDTQLAVPKVYQWCLKNKIQMYPYIGVLESHSTNVLKKRIINVLFQRNIAVYKKCTCFVKTPMVEEKVRTLGIKNTVLTPVGLDVSLLHKDYKMVSSAELKAKYGYKDTDKALLFIGRLIEEKQPIRMIEIFSEIRKKDKSYKLLMIGTGELKDTVEKRIMELCLNREVRMVDRIPNNEIWKLYRMADTFVNLNQQEIFGMSILEAMYYGCKVVAWKAPGPNLIIEQGVSGWLAESNEDVINYIRKKNSFGDHSHDRVMKSFTWNSTARKIAEILKEENRYE